MSEEAAQHTPNEIAPDANQVVISASAGYPETQKSIVPETIEQTPLAWQVGQGYGNQLSSEYVMNPMTAEPVDFEQGEAPPISEIQDEDTYVIDPDKLALLSESERKVYFYEKAKAMVEHSTEMRRVRMEEKEKNELEPLVAANMVLAKEYQEEIDQEKAEMYANTKPTENWGPQAQKASKAWDVGSAVFKTAIEFAPRAAMAGVLLAGVGVGEQAHAQNPVREIAGAAVGIITGRAQTEVGIQNEGNKRYGEVDARHEDKRARLEDKYEDVSERIIEKYDAKKRNFNSEYVRAKEALYARNASQAQIDAFEEATSQKFIILKQQREDELNAAARKFGLAQKHDTRAEKRELKEVNRQVRNQRGDADATVEQQGIGALGKVLKDKIQKR